MRLVFAEPAARKLDDIIDYIALDNPPAAETVYRAIVTAAERLLDFPKISHAGRLLVATSSALALLAVPALADDPVSKTVSSKTRMNLEAAMHGEAYANLKYLRYAEQAEAAGKPELAKLFRDSANIEANEHFDREAQALKLGGANSANLEDAMAGEHYENVTMYINFAKQAEADGDTKVAAMFRQIAADEGTHFEAYKAALAKLNAR